MTEEYQIRKLQTQDREKFLECFNEGIPSSPKTPSDFDWQYVNNPAGCLRGYGAFLDERLVAIYVVSPVRFQIGEKIILGAQSMDTLTLPCAQKKGLFKKLGLQTYESLAREGLVQFTYGFPNQNSKHGFVKYLDWTLFDPCPFLVRVLNTSCILRRMKLPFRFSLDLPVFSGRRPQYLVNQVENLPAGLDTLWHSFKETVPIGVVRDEAYLRWRFEMKPKANYSYFEVRTTKGELEGIGVLRIMNKAQGRIAYLMELMTNKGNRRAAKELLGFMMKKGRLEKAEIMAVRIGKNHPFFRLFIAQGFLPLPGWLQRSKVYPGYVAHNAKLKSTLDHQQKWHINYADDDTL